MPAKAAFNSTLTALWAALDADSALSAIIGTKGLKYKFASADKLFKLEYEPHNCPILAIAPAPGGNARRPARRRRGDGLAERLSLVVEGVTAGHAVENILALESAFNAAIEADMSKTVGGESGSLLGAQYVDEIEFEGLSFDPGLNDHNVIEVWQFRVTLNISFRIS